MNSSLTDSSFAAWSLYTGPSHLKPLFPDSNWILGRWGDFEPGEKLTAQSIKEDIDSRIMIVVKAFTLYCNNSDALHKHFVVPEFFFRCKSGPYPLVEIKEEHELFGQYPIDYIKDRLYGELLETIKSFSSPNTTYTIVCGSILTSNIEDYKSFWQSGPVQRRLALLNLLLKPEILKRKESTYTEKAPKSEKIHVTWKRHLTSKVEKSESKLSAKDPAVEYTLDTWMRGFRTAPLCTVRNRGIYYYYGSLNFNKAENEKTLEVRVYEKQYESKIDLTMGVLDENGNLTHGNMITEWMANYPSYSSVQGDKQSGEPYETNARFDYTENTSQKFDIGVEIDLDHKLQRLRRTVGMNIKNGASLNHYPIKKQFIPSAGMQIQAESVSVHGSSVVFNADGFSPIYWDSEPKIIHGKEGEIPQLKGIASGVYVLAGESKWAANQSADGQDHYSHSQIAFTTPESTLNGHNNELGIKNKQCESFEIVQESNVGTTTPINTYIQGFIMTKIPGTFRQHNESETRPLFCAGTGELHVYNPKNKNIAKSKQACVKI